LSFPILPVGSSGTIELKAKITTGVQGKIYSNRVQISSDTAEMFPGDNIAVATTILGNIANLYTTISLPPTYSPNTLLEAHITYGNNGNQTTTGTQLTVALDPHFTLLSASISGSTTSGNQLLFPLNEVASATSGHLTLQLQVASDPQLVEDYTSLVLTASISSQTPELNLTDNFSTAQTLPLQ
jgi:hypothetical protein